MGNTTLSTQEPITRLYCKTPGNFKVNQNEIIGTSNNIVSIHQDVNILYIESLGSGGNNNNNHNRIGSIVVDNITSGGDTIITNNGQATGANRHVQYSLPAGASLGCIGNETSANLIIDCQALSKEDIIIENSASGNVVLVQGKRFMCKSMFLVNRKSGIITAPCIANKVTISNLSSGIIRGPIALEELDVSNIASGIVKAGRVSACRVNMHKNNNKQVITIVTLYDREKIIKE
jgi:hypothetical protein